MKTITLIFHPENFNESRQCLHNVNGTWISPFMFRIAVEHSELEAGINFFEYVLAGIPNHIFVHSLN